MLLRKVNYAWACLSLFLGGITGNITRTRNAQSPTHKSLSYRLINLKRHLKKILFIQVVYKSVN